jgi:endo-alpha-N-acetylgalactosaminidase
MKTKIQLLLTLTPALAAVLFLAGSSPSLSRAADAAPAKVELKFVRADSEETAGENGRGANAVDGDTSTIWHTQWQDASPECPHEIVLELTTPTTINGFTYLPRQDEQENGTIKAYEFYVSDDGKDFGQPVAKGEFENSKSLKTVTFEAKAAHFVKLKALSEVNGNAWTSAAEITVAAAPAGTAPTPAKPTLKFVKADSEETAGEDGKGANAVDGDPNTFWHTQWQDANPPCPHEIILELTPPTKIKGFTYLPRQDDSDHGEIKDYEFYTSNDGADFGQPLAKGAFAAGKELKTVTLIEPQTCRFIKLKALSEINGEAWTSAAEIGVVQ